MGVNQISPPAHYVSSLFRTDFTITDKFASFILYSVGVINFY